MPITRRTDHHLPAGTAAGDPPYALDVSPQGDEALGWCSLRIVELGSGERHALSTGHEEMLVLPLAGSCTVTCDGAEFVVEGRDSVFSRVTDSVYVPRDAEVVIASTGDRPGRFALPAARCTNRLPPRYRAAGDVPVEVRGAGQATRQVNNIASADAFAADKLMAVEVITPAGNWSSYPPHKHDQHRPGEESELEEVYYFEISDGSDGTSTARRHGFGLHRVYGTGARPIDVRAEVRTGDVVLIPHGWHGPSAAAPGYDMYYLNVMSGPGTVREWLICDDPAHAWVRDEWTHQSPDPRLPLTSS